MKSKTLQTVVYQEGKYFVAQCLNVDVSSFGSTEEEAIEQLREALDLYFEDAPMPITKVSHPIIRTLNLSHA